jgi:hypothetical protein
VIRDEQRLHLELDHDGFAKEQPVVVSDTLDRLQFTIENRTGGAHETGLSIAGLPAGQYAVTVDGRRVADLQGGAQTIIRLPIGSAAATRVGIARVR